MSRRATAAVVAALVVVTLSMAGALIPVPYVVLQPGPTANTLGELDGKPLITVDGHPTYPAQGHLDLVTVTYQGGPGAHLDLFRALRGWIDPHAAVVPSRSIFGEGLSSKQVEAENVRLMTDSQQLATAAALRELKIPVTTEVQVAEVVEGTPADGRLKAGDVLTEVDGTAVASPDAAADLITGRAPGRPVTLTLGSGARRREVTLTTAAGSAGKAAVGIVVAPRFKFPFTVRISVNDIGGPSAGLMFALGLVDKLTPGSITGGRYVAGTGTIDADGMVGSIGGIQQKMLGARGRGATVFLTPAENCDEAVAAVPEGLRLVRVATLGQALDALESLRAGRHDLPTCPGSGAAARTGGS